MKYQENQCLPFCVFITGKRVYHEISRSCSLGQHDMLWIGKEIKFRLSSCNWSIQRFKRTMMENKWHFRLLNNLVSTRIAEKTHEDIPQAPVVQTLDSAIHWINHYSLDNSIGFASVYPVDSDLSGGQRYPSFEQLGPDFMSSSAVVGNEIAIHYSTDKCDQN